uniref:Uncharacterized protein n=1 Tax=Octopus bimaculoides TaxID=37653 RepID=A0A0L8HL27_OCTBM
MLLLNDKGFFFKRIPSNCSYSTSRKSNTITSIVSTKTFRYAKVNGQQTRYIILHLMQLNTI